MPTESGLYWDTCVSFTMLALFLANYLKVADYYIVMLVTKTLLQIEVVVVVVVIVLKWKYVMSNSCSLSGVLVLESRVTCKNDNVHNPQVIQKEDISKAFRALLY